MGKYRAVPPPRGTARFRNDADNKLEREERFHMKRSHFYRLAALSLAILIGILPGCAGPKNPASSNGGTSTAPAMTESVPTEEITTPSTEATKDTGMTEKPTTTRRRPDTKATTTKTTASTTKPPAPRPCDSKVSDDVFFGYYGLTIDSLEMDISAITYSETDYVNVMLCGSTTDEVTYALQLAKKNNCKIWINIHSALFTSPTILSGVWQKRFDEVDTAARNSGAYDYLLGYYLDEPLLTGISHEDLIAVTKYQKQQFGKRFFVCFAASGISTDIWTPPAQASPPITKEAAQYITDVAFDIYWNFKEYKSTYDKAIADMKARIGRDDVYVWYVPCVMNGSGKFSEPLAIEHLQGMYDYLKKEKKPGGLMCYTLRTSNGDGLGNIGLDEMEDNPWNKLRKECQRIGREITSGKLDK